MLEFGNFIVAVIRKPIFLFFLLAVIVGGVLQLVLPLFSLPQTFYLGLIFAGFVGSAYQLYRDQSQALQRALNPVPVEPVQRSQLTVSFRDGNAYAYSITDPYAGQNAYFAKMEKSKKVKARFDERGLFHIDGRIYYLMGKGKLEINLRIQNSGDLALDVLDIDSNDNLNTNYLLIYHSGVYHQGRRLGLPFHLKPGEIADLQFKYRITLNKGANNALYAADFRALPRSILHEIKFETVDEAGTKRSYTAQTKTPSKPLVDLYVKQWQEFNQEEYLVLAGFGPKMASTEEPI